MDWKKKMTYHALMYLAGEQTVIGVRQLHKKKWARQPITEMCTWATQPKDILYMGVRQLLMEDLCVGVGQLQLGVRNLPLEDLCVGVRQLLVDGCYREEVYEPMIWIPALS
jgi:hypothetical protein